MVCATDTAKLHDVLDKYGIANSFEIYPGTHTSAVADRFPESRHAVLQQESLLPGTLSVAILGRKPLQTAGDFELSAAHHTHEELLKAARTRHIS